MFSPYYAWARRHAQPPGGADPMRHCALNVALYGGGRRRWAMTERGAAAIARDAANLRIGRSHLAWDGTALTINIDEMAALWPRRIRGTLRLFPEQIEHQNHALDAAGRHLWSPIAPCARVELQLDQPALRWQGAAYCDMNTGTAPLEADFRRWDWCRAPDATGTTVLYDITRRNGETHMLALRYSANAPARAMVPPPRQSLPPTRWAVARSVRADTPDTARVRETLQDTPFYARSVVAAAWHGAQAVALHESLDLDRFSRRWVQAMLPFRMPRRWF